MTKTVTDGLIDTLADVLDLDQLHTLVSNDYTDRYSSPLFNSWLVELLNTERRRRQSGEVATDYPMHVFSEWPPSYLVQATTLSLVMVEAAVLEGEPTIVAFTFKLCELLTGAVCLAFLKKAQAAQ